MALRLARFNAALDGAPAPAYAYNFFAGVPAPAGAGLALFPLFLGLEARSMHWVWLQNAAHNPLFCALVLVGTALLVISTLPVWSFKNFKVPAEYVLPLLLGTGTFAAVLVADPWAALAAAGLIYLGMLPFSVRSFRRLRAEAERRHEAEPEDKAGDRSRPVTIGCTVLATDGDGARRRAAHRAWRGGDAGLHAGRHRRDGEGHDGGRGARDRRADRARQHLPPDAAAGRRTGRARLAACTGSWTGPGRS